MGQGRTVCGRGLRPIRDKADRYFACGVGPEARTGGRYEADELLAETPGDGSDVYRMPGRYELRLYEALRGAFQQQGYEVRCLNGESWQGLRLREIVAQAKGVDAVCAVHYAARRTHAVLNDDENTWWTVFEGMRVDLRCGVFDVASGDVIYRLEGDAIGTEDLHAHVEIKVAEEPLYQGDKPIKSSFNQVLGVYVTEESSSSFGKFSHYRIAIYRTSVRDPKTGERILPLIRTPKGAFDISFVSNPENPDSKSILDRLLEYVPYRPEEDEVEYFDLRTLDLWGEMMRERIPKRHP